MTKPLFYLTNLIYTYSYSHLLTIAHVMLFFTNKLKYFYNNKLDSKTIIIGYRVLHGPTLAGNIHKLVYSLLNYFIILFF
jgi:hypothetical protein